MKTTCIKKVFLILFIGFFIANCTTDTLEVIEEDAIENNLQKRENGNEEVEPPEYSDNELVVKYAKHITTERQRAEIRKRNGVISFETCNCEDNSIELWKYPNGVRIEDRLLGSHDDPGLDGSEYQYLLELFNNGFANQEQDTEHLQSLLKPASGVTIAILDTGIDYKHATFKKPFLYKHEEQTFGCEDEPLYSGWNFVDNNNDIMDDNGHGTIIAEKMYVNLMNTGTNFQLLPVKIFDFNGQTTYFRILCGLRFVQSHNAKIVTMSFGWYFTSFDLMKDFIVNTEEEILYITSAGNNRKNIDIVAHFPSNFNDENIISVAGMESWMHNLWNDSNYGENNADIGALAQGISFNYQGIPFTVSGTSYSVSFVAARAGKLFNGNLPSDLKDSVIYSGQYEHSLITGGANHQGQVTKYPYVIHGNQ